MPRVRSPLRVDRTISIRPIFLSTPSQCYRRDLSTIQRQFTIVYPIKYLPSFVFCSAVQEERGPRVRTKIVAVARDFFRVSSSASTPLPPPISLSSSEPGIATPILTTKNTMMRYHTSNASDNTAGISSSSTRQIYSPRSPKILSTGNGSLHPIVLESFSFLSRVDRKGKS